MPHEHVVVSEEAVLLSWVVPLVLMVSLTKVVLILEGVTAFEMFKASIVMLRSLGRIGML